MWITFRAAQEHEKYRDTDKWILLEAIARETIIPGEHVSPRLTLLNGLLTVHKGFTWDGGSGPAIDTATFMSASMVHDAFYELMRKGSVDRKHRKKADKLMKQICKECGMSWARRQWVYWAVRLGARGASKGSKS